jgi:quercetin dioxygenase-like cupin family protein
MEFIHHGVVLARLIRSSEIIFNELNFYSLPDEGIQFGTWGYDKGKSLAAHNHKKHDKLSLRTSELIFVLSGGLKVSLYTELDEILSEFTILVGDVLICLAGGHGYEVLEDGTKILEIKNGPYFGTEVDRRRI